MTVILNELKKIWSIRILAIVTLLCSLFYVSWLHDWVEHYPKGTWFLGVDFAHHLTENYGSTLSRENFEDFLTFEEAIISELDEYIAANDFFAGVGILSYADYVNFREDFGTRIDELRDEEMELWYAVSLEWGVTVRTREGVDRSSHKSSPEAFVMLMSFGNIVGLYETNILGYSEWLSTIDWHLEHTNLTEQERQRLIEIRDSGELINIMASETIFHTWRYARHLAVLVILVTLIMVAPLITADRANRVNWLQYSSKQGRSILKKQFVAVIISAVGITTILVAIFGGIFGALNETYALWNNGINSFMGSPYHWLSITYGQYVLLIVGIIYALSIGVAAFGFVLSRFSQNMVRLLFKVIPIFVVSLIMSNWILDEFLGIYVGGNFAVQMTSLAFSLLAGIVIAMCVVHRERKVELF